MNRKVISYIENLDDLESLANSNIDLNSLELILSCDRLSRYGQLPFEKLNLILNNCKKLKVKTILEWDILMTELEFRQVVEDLKQIDLSLVDIFRVQDPGALFYIANNFSQKIQLILENGHHNYLSIETYLKNFSNRIERIVLSLELPKDKIIAYAKQLSVPVEILVLGKILVFYTPRKLLSPLYFKHEDNKTRSINSSFIMAQGESEESPHKGFPLIENRHGTFMFHVKDQCIIEHLDELVSENICFRFDLRRTEHQKKLARFSQLLQSGSIQELRNLKLEYQSEVIKGYFNVNKSDVLFPKLKNQKIQRKDENFIGQVLEVSKDKYIVIELKSQKNILKMNDKIQIVNPEGKIKEIEILSLRDISFQDCKEIKSPHLAVIKYVPSIVAMSSVYRVD